MDNYYRQIELPISIDEFRILPQNAAYKYEYFDSRAVLSPRPKTFTAVREIPGELLRDSLWPVDIHSLPPAEIPTLGQLFTAAMWSTQPFASLEPNAADAAAADCLDKTIAGNDGPIIESACFRATDPRQDSHLIGGILVTLVPDEVRTVPFAGLWKEPPPADAVARRLGCPHLTWVFAHPWQRRHGVGTALLAAAVKALADLGFRHLASTFQLDNGPSVLWHWRNGFRLLPQFSAIAAEYRDR